MMREILFRGKRVANGKWVEGDLIQIFHLRELKYIRRGEVEYLIDNNTVGQFTGLRDKNGNKIFEGDIVKYNCTLHEVVFCTINGCAFFGITMPERGEIWNFDGITDSKRAEVVGNIYDNPELIGGEGNAEIH